VITLGTGIGSAFIFDGKLLPNAELGHLEVDGHDAETKASAVARERDGLSWDEYSVLLQPYFSHIEFLFPPNCSSWAVAFPTAPMNTFPTSYSARRSCRQPCETRPASWAPPSKSP
jgi:hypothetical protein